MKTLYLDPCYGISGDLLVGSLLMHVDRTEFLDIMSCFEDIAICIKEVEGFHHHGLSVSFEAKKDVQERHLRDIIFLLKNSALPKVALENSLEIFDRLAQVESKIHGVSQQDLHFHEVGALDSIGDIASCALLFSMIDADRIISSPPNVGTGTVVCAHGELPVPPPAVEALLSGVPRIATGNGERTTPTGAAVLTHYLDRMEEEPPGKAKTVGFGFGDRMFPDGNYLRTVII